jgi:hypothetical protein
MKAIFSIIVCAFTLMVNNCYADRFAYQDSTEIKIENENHLIIHKHNWRIRWIQVKNESLKTSTDSMISSSIYCINKNTGDTMFKYPSPAFTYLKFDNNSNYIIACTSINVMNPYQLCIYDINGNIIKKRHISKLEAKLNTTEYEIFKNKFTNEFNELDKCRLIYKIDTCYYIDYIAIENDTLAEYLYCFKTKNHISPNISGSVSNYIYWYKNERAVYRGHVDENNNYDPNFKINFKNNKPYSLEFLDPRFEKAEILIQENTVCE